MRQSQQEAEQSYRKRSPSRSVPLCERLLHHFTAMREFTYPAKEFAGQLMHAPASRVAVIIAGDTFRGIKICGSAIEDALIEEMNSTSTSEFRLCWSAFQLLLSKLNDCQATVKNDVALKSFVLLFLATAVMREFVNASISKKAFLSEEEMFEAKTYPLSDEEKSIVKSLAIPIFETNVSFADQLRALTQNLNLISSLIK